jgi:hypothetical protein
VVKHGAHLLKLLLEGSRQLLGGDVRGRKRARRRDERGARNDRAGKRKNGGARGARGEASKHGVERILEE